MNACVPMQPDAKAIGAFVDALFRYADQDTYVSLRAFRDGANQVFRITPHGVGDSLEGLAQTAAIEATMAANHAAFPVVFAPPIATFTNTTGAREDDLANGLALSVECDATPAAARERLEGLLGPATVIVASGGEWMNPATGVIEAKLHLHWRLTEPTREASDHMRLKLARALATALVGGDASNTPAVHPIRWPGSWHRKKNPRLARIEALHGAREIDLADALELLTNAAEAARLGSTGKVAGGRSACTGEARETAELVRAVLTAEDYHAALVSLAMRFLKGGTPDAQTVLMLRGIMLAIPEAQRDQKNGSHEPGRWQARFDDIARAVSTARAKIGDRSNATPKDPGGEWPEPIDFLGDTDMTGPPLLRADHLPDALAGLVFDTAGRMGVDPASVALCAVVTCAAAVHEDWAIQPKRFDQTWTERARLWGAIVGDPSVLKTPVLSAATSPVDLLDAQAQARHADAMREYRRRVAELKAAKVPPEGWPRMPKRDRYMVEGTTVEALTEVLRGDDDAKQRAPLGRVLVRQDELSGWLADMDRYKAGGKGGGDRAAYLRLFNGGRYVLDRVVRGSFDCPSWSGCVLGGIQPEPIQRIANDAADDGLLQRFLYCVPGAHGEGEDRTPDHAALARYSALFPLLANTLRPQRLFPATVEAPSPVVLHQDAHRHREEITAMARAIASMPDTSPRLKAALGKVPGIFARLALTFHLVGIADAMVRGEEVPCPAILPEAVARRAADYMRDVLLPHLLRAEALLFVTRQTGHARWIAGHILASADVRSSLSIAARDIQRSYGALRAPEQRRELVAVMEALEVMGWVRAVPPDNPIRPVPTWRVNPKLHERFADRAAAERQRRDAAREAVSEAIRRKGGRAAV